MSNGTIQSTELVVVEAHVQEIKGQHYGLL